MHDRGPEQAVPATVSSFVGRASELATIRQLLARERLVSMVGPGGSGKTRLAIQTVRAISSGLPLLGFVELAAVEPGADLASAVLTGCGIRDEPGRSPADRLRDRLRSSDGVLVLDNCEQILDEVAVLVAGLVRDCATVRVLVTSRVSLGVAGETVVPIGGLDSEDDAAALFLDRARRVQPLLPAGPGTDALVRRICRLADGLPLAIELAAAHARALALPDIEAGMADRLRFLTTRDPGVLPQHRSLQASIAWSATLVGDRAREVLAALAVFGGRFTLDAALAVSGQDARGAVETLVDHSLVQFDPDDGRYLLLDTIRDYAATELTDAGAGAQATLIRWVAALAGEAGPGLGRADAGALARVERDDAAVRSALAHALHTGTDLGLAAGAVVELAFAWSLRGRCADGRDWARRIGAVLDPVPPGLAWAEAFLAVYSGDLETGVGLAAAAAEAAAAAGDRRTRARSLILVGAAQMFADPAGADPVLAEAVALAEAVGDDWGHVESLQTLAYAHLNRTDHRSALSCADAALPALDRLGHDQLRAWDAAIRADVAAQTGRFEPACAFGRAGMAAAVAIGEPVSATAALLPLVRALNQLGRAREAAEAVAAHERFLDSHPGLGTAVALDLAATITEWWADPAAATDRIEQARSAAADSGFALLAGEAGAMLAVALLAGGDADGAREAAAAALRWAGVIGSHEVACAALLARCVADRRLGTDATADAHRALVDAAAAGLDPLVPDALDVVAGLALDAGRVAVAARLHAASGRARDQLGAAVSPIARLFRGDDESAVAAALGTRDRAAARDEGERLDLDRAVAYARRARGRRARPRAGWDSLTPAESAVVELAAQGLSNRAIGAQLLVTSGTVRTHLRSVFAKVGVTSRAELAAQAVRRGG